jgi:hypothetical protein
MRLNKNLIFHFFASSSVEYFKCGSKGALTVINPETEARVTTDNPLKKKVAEIWIKASTIKHIPIKGNHVQPK